MKYMVMECHPGYAVVLDDTGNFLKVANRHYEVGQVVTEVLRMREPPKKPVRKWMYSVVSIAACLAIIFGVSLRGIHNTYASVYVKINPEVRIDVDRQDRVVELSGVNPDGITLIEGYDFHHKDLELVTDELVDLAIDKGYLQAEGEITISLESADQTWVDNHAQVLSTHVQDHVREHFAVTVHIQFHHTEHTDQEECNPESVETTSHPAVSEPMLWEKDDDHEEPDDDDHEERDHDDHEEPDNEHEEPDHDDREEPDYDDREERDDDHEESDHDDHKEPDDDHEERDDDHEEPDHDDPEERDDDHKKPDHDDHEESDNDKESDDDDED